MKVIAPAKTRSSANQRRMGDGVGSVMSEMEIRFWRRRRCGSGLRRVGGLADHLLSENINRRAVLPVGRDRLERPPHQLRTVHIFPERVERDRLRIGDSRRRTMAAKRLAP